MLALLFDFCTFLLNSFYEFVVYIFVDIVVKTSLQETSDERDKQKIWLFESATLFILCSGIYAFHHTPYLLLFAAIATLIYTQLKGRVNFRYWWFLLVTRWDEFQQHEESMELMQQNRERLNNSHPPPNIQVTMGPTHTQHWMPQAQTAPMPMPAFDNSPRIDAPPSIPQFEAWYPADQNKNSTTHAGPISSTPIVSQSTYGLRQRNMDNVMPTPIYSHPTPSFMPCYPPPQMMPPPPRQDLARRPLHPRNTSPVIQYKSKGLSEFVKSKVRAAFRMPEPVSAPPGLSNNGNNLCFLNAVLQCVANSPGVAESLGYLAHNNMLKCPEKHANFVKATIQLFEKMRAHPSEVEKQAEDTVEFREAASQIAGSMITSPTDLHNCQEQQDAAEYLMWMLGTLHTATNIYFPHQQNNNQFNHHPHHHQAAGLHRFGNMNLTMLKFLYSEFSPQRLEQAKQDCRKEIALAKSVDSDAYVEPIQRLADLEWLSHKDKNRSAIDDLFTGQLVEAQHCLSCFRISVGIQTFNILPVPIVEPRELTGLVYLEDCFAKFGHTEDLSGPDGLRCENCSNVDLGASPVFTNGGRTNAVLRRPPPRRLVQPPSDSPIPSHAAMSPIPGGAGEMFNDSGYLPNAKSIRTSTPINSGGPMSVKTTDGQKRSLLRQLPECLVVQLMRFTMRQGDGGPSKIAAPVTIPLTQLDLTRLVIDNVMVHNQRPDSMQPGTSFRYSLYALCLHLGADSTATGHYVSYVRAAADNTWYRYDDARVTPVNMEYELNTRQVRENAYLLFYKKVM